MIFRVVGMRPHGSLVVPDFDTVVGCEEHVNVTMENILALVSLQPAFRVEYQWVQSGAFKAVESLQHLESLIAHVTDGPDPPSRKGIFDLSKIAVDVRVGWESTEVMPEFPAKMSVSPVQYLVDNGSVKQLDD